MYPEPSIVKLTRMTEKSENPGTESVEKLILRGKEEIENLLELSEVGFFDEGERYSFEQITGEEIWEQLSEEQKAEFLKGMGEILEVQLLSINEDDIIRREFQEGVKGEITEKGADVTVLKTKYPEFEVHIMVYNDPSLPEHYDIVKTA